MQIGDDIESMPQLSIPLPAHRNRSGRLTEAELEWRQGGPTVIRLQGDPIDDASPDHPGSFSRKAFGTELITLPQRPLQVVIRPKPAIGAQDHLLALKRRKPQRAFQLPNRLLEGLVAQGIAGIEERTDTLLVVGGSNSA